MTRKVLGKFGFVRTALVVGVGIPFIAALSAYGQDAAIPQTGTTTTTTTTTDRSCRYNAGSGTRYRNRFKHSDRRRSRSEPRFEHQP